MSLSKQYETLEKDIKDLQLNFTQIFTSGCHYNTQEIINHITYINNGLDNIKLDYEFQRASKNWAKQFDPNEMKLNETSKLKNLFLLEISKISLRLLNIDIRQLIFKGNDLAQQLNIGLHTTTIKNKEENQLREIHSWACEFNQIYHLQFFLSNVYFFYRRFIA